MASPVALIFGAGSNVGAALANGFLGANYYVATVSRSASSIPSQANHLHIQADLSDPTVIPGIFAKVASHGWSFPSVIIWNAFAYSAPAASDPTNPFALPEESLDRDLNLMIKSPFIAAREAVKAWSSAEGGNDKGRKGTFIMTGNWLPRRYLPQKEFPPAPIANVMTLGVGKSGANYWMATAHDVFTEKGIRFFYADERDAAGSAAGMKPNGDSHAEMFLKLAKGCDDLPYYVTFVDGKHVEFAL